MPSEVENYPVSLMEAMAAGTAIITTKGTGCSEVVADTALLVEPRNVRSLQAALTTLTSSDQLCRKLGCAARKRLENHLSWQKVGDQYEHLYAQCARTDRWSAPEQIATIRST